MADLKTEILFAQIHSDGVDNFAEKYGRRLKRNGRRVNFQK